MLLQHLVENLKYTPISGDTHLDISHLTIDSRQAKAGSLFVCICGIHTDGHKFIPAAYAQGCRAFLCEKPVDNLPQDATALLVDSSRAALAEIAKVFYGNPTSKFSLIGVTGTNGKTSTTYFMESILATLNQRVGVIGTVEVRMAGKKLDLHLATSTTPDTVELNQIFDYMVQQGADSVVMEVSSHSLELDKVKGMAFECGIFTNLTQDHLDFHGSMENYGKAKAKLFTMCKRGVVNIDDSYSSLIMEQATCPVTTFGVNNPADVQAVNIEYFMDKTTFDVLIGGKSYSLTLNVPGGFSVYNALGVIAAAYAMGIPMENIIKGVSNIKGVPGRIQNIPNSHGFNVIVDYAHTPDGVENILKAVRGFTKGRIITVFGCGGDRDRTKRPIMGALAAKLGDISLVTSDNPRSEEPMDIIKEIEVGIKPITQSYELIPDRREAIFRAVKLAKPGDSIVIAGKGHEDYEIFKDKTIHFDDAEVAAEALEGLN